MYGWWGGGNITKRFMYGWWGKRGGRDVIVLSTGSNSGELMGQERG